MKDLIKSVIGKDLSINAHQRHLRLKVVPRSISLEGQYCIGMGIKGTPFVLLFDDRIVAQGLGHDERLQPLSSLPESLALAMALTALTPLLESLGVDINRLEWIPSFDQPLDYLQFRWEEGGGEHGCFLLGFLPDGHSLLEEWLEGFESHEEALPAVGYRVAFGHTFVSQDDLNNLEVGDVLLLEEDYREAGVLNITLSDGGIFQAEYREEGLSILGEAMRQEQDGSSHLQKVIFEFPECSLDPVEAATLCTGAILPPLHLESDGLVMRLREEILATGSIVRLNNLNGVLISSL